MSKMAAEKAYSAAGVTAEDVQVVELHDCFSANELITYEALGKHQPFNIYLFTSNFLFY